MKEADRIFCNPYERNIWRDEKETLLCAALMEELRRNGYAYPDSVLYRAEHGQEKYSLGALKRIWKTHKRLILERCCASYGKPTSAQKERWDLCGDGYILTAAGELPVFDVELTEPNEKERIPF